MNFDPKNLIEYEATIPVEEYIAKYVDFKATEVRYKECTNYGTRWFCPPYDFDPVEDVWKKYSDFKVFCVKMMTAGIGHDDVIPMFFEAKKYFDEVLLKRESECEGSLAVSAGFCARCEVCARTEGKPCRMPEKARCAIEALGGLVDGTIKGLFDFDVLWAKGGEHPEYYILIGGLLTGKK